MKKKNFIVDDEKNILTSVSLILKIADYEVETAKNGIEAFDKMGQQKKGKLIDLIITGIIMSNSDGQNFITKLHRHNVWVPVIVFDRHSEKNTMVKLLCKGCVNYIDKPFEPAGDVQRVNNLFDKHIRK